MADATTWDARYSGRELVWGGEPNRWVAAECADLPPGRALDLACGEGRNALWLARRGWQVTGVDFSGVALARAAELAAAAAADPEPAGHPEPAAGQPAGPAGLASRVSWVQADLLDYRPDASAFALVLLSYLQLPADQRTVVVRSAASALAPGGRLLVVAHHADNLTAGVGGPPDPRVLYSAQDVAADLSGLDGIRVERAERVLRPVESAEGVRHAVDALLLARRD